MGAPGHLNPRHHCHAIDCDVSCLPRFFMCARHWHRLRAVAPAQAQRILDTYVPGQETRKDPSSEYLQAAKEAQQVLFANEIIYGYEYDSQAPPVKNRTQSYRSRMAPGHAYARRRTV